MALISGTKKVSWCYSAHMSSLAGMHFQSIPLVWLPCWAAEVYLLPAQCKGWEPELIHRLLRARNDMHCLRPGRCRCWVPPDSTGCEMTCSCLPPHCRR